MKLTVFKSYFMSCGILYVSVGLAFYLVYLAAQTFTNIWLSEWSNDPPSANGSQDLGLRDLRLGVYGAMGGVQGG